MERKTIFRLVTGGAVLTTFIFGYRLLNRNDKEIIKSGDPSTAMSEALLENYENATSTNSTTDAIPTSSNQITSSETIYRNGISYPVTHYSNGTSCTTLVSGGTAWGAEEVLAGDSVNQDIFEVTNPDGSVTRFHGYSGPGPEYDTIDLIR